MKTKQVNSRKGETQPWQNVVTRWQMDVVRNKARGGDKKDIPELINTIYAQHFWVRVERVRTKRRIREEAILTKYELNCAVDNMN